MSASDKRIIVFEILTWWHPGTGRGDGATADAVAHRGADGLPFLPGRTVKGLVRDACRLGAAAGLSSELTPADLTRLFGSAPPKVESKQGDEEFQRVHALEEARFRTTPGSLRFSNARIGSSPNQQACWSAWGRNRKVEDKTPVATHLYRYIASTAIDQETGTAKDQTLRNIEVVVPLTLHAFVLGVDGRAGTPWDAIDESLQVFLRALGSHRNRGLGRVCARLVTP